MIYILERSNKYELFSRKSNKYKSYFRKNNLSYYSQEAINMSHRIVKKQLIES